MRTVTDNARKCNRLVPRWSLSSFLGTRTWGSASWTRSCHWLTRPPLVRKVGNEALLPALLSYMQLRSAGQPFLVAFESRHAFTYGIAAPLIPYFVNFFSEAALPWLIELRERKCSSSKSHILIPDCVLRHSEDMPNVDNAAGPCADAPVDHA